MGSAASALMNSEALDASGMPHLLQKQASSSVSSSIAEFIPMRSIIKSQMKELKQLASLEVTNRPFVAKQTTMKQKKRVRFDDMILIGDNEDNIKVFLSDEESSIVDKKSTPTRLNMQSSPELRKRLKQEQARKKNEQKKPLPKEELTIDKVIESKRRRTQTARFGQDCPVQTKSGQNTKACSPEVDDKQSQSPCSSSSPEKQDMSSEYDYSYDGDSDMGNSSKLKNRRRNKKHRKDQNRQRQSPSPSKYEKRRYGEFDSSGEKEAARGSQVDQARHVAAKIKSSSSNKLDSNNRYYQPLETTKSGMSAQARERMAQFMASQKRH